MISESSQLQHVTDEACAARAAWRAQEEFLDRMSHELGTPLTAVIGFSKVLESNAAGNQRPEDLDMLPLARRLCHAMGCQLIVQSQPGKGSRFTIRFPKDR